MTEQHNALSKWQKKPEWEAKFEPNSFGFRPGRSCLDAREAIHNAICTKPKYVLDADISQCFDKINHKKLLKKLNTFPTLRRQIRAWLKAGVWDDKKLFPTLEGTPQGGISSPLLANIALHGMEECVKKYAETIKLIKPGGSATSKGQRRNALSLIRYADDFVILHEKHSAILRCREIISEWLEDMGLELKPSKTRITHTLHNVGKEKAGFDFLGFNIKQHKIGKYTSGRDTRGRLLGYKTVIRPSRDSIRKHYKQISEIIDKCKSSKQQVLIERLNPVIRGWCNYYSTSVSKKIFSKLSHLVWWKLWKWAVSRHRNKGKKWLKDKYFRQETTYNKELEQIKMRNWIFATSKDEKIEKRLFHHSDTEIKRHVRVRGEASPYDGNLVYWSTRMGKHPSMPSRKAKLLKTQKGKCNWCSLIFKHDDILEVDHIIPKAKGGTDYYKNLQLLHRHCHDKKTEIDGSNESPFKPAKLPQGWYWMEGMLIT